MRKNPVFKFVFAFFAISIFCCGGCSGCAMIFGDRTYSEGERTGVITKFSNRGLVWKTWEGEMNLGGVRANTEGFQSNVWEFSVTDPELVTQIQELQKKGGSYTLQYRQVISSKPWVSATPYIVSKITPVEQK